MLEGHERRKKNGSAQTGLTGHFESSGKNSRNAKRKGRVSSNSWPSMRRKELLRNRRKRSDQAKDTNPSSKHREQSVSHVQQGNNAFASYSFGGPVAP